MRMGCRIGRVVVGTEIGLGLDDSARHDAVGAAVDEQHSEQPGSDKLGRMLKKTAWEKLAFPGLKFGISISTPQTRTCLWGPRIWSSRLLLL